FLEILQECVERGVKIVTFNPIREKGLERFVNPQNPGQMLTGNATEISCQYHQVKAGGDIAALLGMCKHVLAADEASWAENHRHVLDLDFIQSHTTGFEQFAKKIETTTWEEIERESGLPRSSLEQAAQV